MNEADPDRLDDESVARLHQDHAEPLRRYLVGLLRDASLAEDVLQTAFSRLIEKGGAAQPEKRRAWLFQVATREAMAVRRRQQVGRRVVERVAKPDVAAAADVDAITREEVSRVRMAISELSEEQRVVVQMRMYQHKTFAEISRELKIPLGTALSRMRGAVLKLRAALHAPE